MKVQKMLKGTRPEISHMTQSQSFITTIIVEHTPESAFNAIQYFRAWWSEEIEGNADKLNETFLENEFNFTEYECYKTYEDAWTSYIQDSLKNRIPLAEANRMPRRWT